MKILKPGRKIDVNLTYLYGRCPKCKCEFAVEPYEVFFSTDPKIWPFYMGVCPNAGCYTRKITVWNKQEYLPT